MKLSVEDKLEELVKDYLKQDSRQSLENYLNDAEILSPPSDIPKEPHNIAAFLKENMTREERDSLEERDWESLLEVGLLDVFFSRRSS